MKTRYLVSIQKGLSDCYLYPLGYNYRNEQGNKEDKPMTAFVTSLERGDAIVIDGGRYSISGIKFLAKVEPKGPGELIGYCLQFHDPFKGESRIQQASDIEFVRKECKE